MLNQLLGSEPGALAAFGVALIIGVRSLRNRLQQSKTSSAASAASGVPQSAAQFVDLEKAA